MNKAEFAKAKLESMILSEPQNTIAPSKAPNQHAERQRIFYKSLSYLNSLVSEQVVGTSIDLAMEEVRTALLAARSAKDPGYLRLRAAYETTLSNGNLYDSQLNLGKPQ